MNLAESALEAGIIAHLAAGELLSSVQLQRATGKSQPTLSRALSGLSGQVVALGQGKSTRYGLARPIRGMAAQQPLWWTNQSGSIERWGLLTFLAADTVHVSAPGIEITTRGRLPWFLAPLKAQGFLGRAWALRLGLDLDPERWPLEQLLFAALKIDDPTGAISMGESVGERVPEAPVDLAARAAHYDNLAGDVTATLLPVGSLAGGEQSKFLTGLASGERVLVKFSPPRGTPFGERWRDLLHAEALALQVLGEHGVSVAQTRIIESTQRTYLESTRFDRVGPGGLGRRHLIALDAVHEAFVLGSRQNWPATCDALVLQRRLEPIDARAVRALFEFGQLIGNTDMHFGNLSLWADDPAAARFELAPLYDMLPMRWRTDGFHGLQDYAPFEPPAPRLAPTAEAGALSPRSVALAYWRRAAEHRALSAALRAVAAEMARRLSA
ncbi:MAG: HipA domain-containing protein [Burkholderiales bacterium]